MVETVYTGRQGRPAYHIDPAFLEWAYTQRSTSSISRYLGISRRAVRNGLLAYGIAEPQTSPFLSQDMAVAADSSSPLPETSISDRQPESEIGGPADFVLDPILPMPQQEDLQNSGLHLASSTPLQPGSAQQITSFTGPLSVISDSDLDSVILQLRQQFTHAGITMLHGMLRQLGYRIPHERIRQSLYRIDPVQRIFGHIQICQCTYSVALWHHDGQHGK